MESVYFLVFPGANSALLQALKVNSGWSGRRMPRRCPEDTAWSNSPFEEKGTERARRSLLPSNPEWPTFCYFTKKKGAGCSSLLIDSATCLQRTWEFQLTALQRLLQGVKALSCKDTTSTQRASSAQCFAEGWWLYLQRVNFNLISSS